MRRYAAVTEHVPGKKLYVRDLPGFPGAHRRGAIFGEERANLEEAIGTLLDDGKPKLGTAFVKTHTVVVH